jgi:hypothetical protein
VVRKLFASKVADLGHGASAATVEEAASFDYVLLAVPWPNVEDAPVRVHIDEVPAGVALVQRA